MSHNPTKASRLTGYSLSELSGYFWAQMDIYISLPRNHMVVPGEEPSLTYFSLCGCCLMPDGSSIPFLLYCLPSSLSNFRRFKEKCVMNNYFGIGLDAKISLEFNSRREEHPEQYK
jgi:hypothetical protein